MAMVNVLTLIFKHKEEKCLPGTLLALMTSSLDDTIFCDMALSVCL